MPRLLFKTTRKYYEMALKVYIGQEIVRHISGLNNNSSLADLRNMLHPQVSEGDGKWVDVCGMFAPESKVNEIIDSVKTGETATLSKLNESLVSVYNNYADYSWKWCTSLIASETGTEVENITAENLIQIIADWKTIAIKLNNMTLNDAEKEFDNNSKTGFGIDGDMAVRDLDFRAVRGEYDQNKFVISLQQESKEIEEKANRLSAILENIK
jgi:hypothetical protein